MLIGLAYDDERHGGVAVTYNDFLRSEGTDTRCAEPARYDIAPTGAFEHLIEENRNTGRGWLSAAMMPYYTGLTAQNGDIVLSPEYDENDECRRCGAHIADPHEPECVASDLILNVRIAGRALRDPDAPPTTYVTTR